MFLFCNVGIINNCVRSHHCRQWASKKWTLGFCYLSCGIAFQLFFLAWTQPGTRAAFKHCCFFQFIDLICWYCSTPQVLNTVHCDHLHVLYIDRVATDHNQDNTTFILRDWLVKVQSFYHYVEWRPKEEPM